MQKKFLKFKRRAALRQRYHIRRFKRASRHPFAVPLFTFAGLLVVAVIGYLVLASHEAPAQDSQVVIISHDHEEQTVPSVEPTVGALLKKLNITLGHGDVVEPSPATKINQDDFRINIYRAVPVEIVDGSQKTYTFSAATTARAIANQTGANLYPADSVITRPTTDFLRQGAVGEQVIINRATPVTLNLYGTATAIRTQAKTVGRLIQDKGIRLGAKDQVMPSPNTPITPNMQIAIVRNGIQIQSITQAIPMPVQTIADSGLAYGTSAVRQQGSAGQEVITYQVNTQNGQVVSRVAIQTVVTQPPVTEIVAQGDSLSGIKGDMALAGIASSDYNFADYIISHESGWCPTKAQGEHSCPSVPDNQYTSGGYGLCQATPGYKMSSDGSDWATNPITQLKWCAGYANSRYGGWYNAYEHWLSHHNW